MHLFDNDNKSYYIIDTQNKCWADKWFAHYPHNLKYCVIKYQTWFWSKLQTLAENYKNISQLLV